MSVVLVFQEEVIKSHVCVLAPGGKIRQLIRWQGRLYNKMASEWDLQNSVAMTLGQWDLISHV